MFEALASICTCHLNTHTLEALIFQGAQGSIGVGLTFLQFLFVTVTTFFFVFDFRRRQFCRRRLELKTIALIVVLFVTISVGNNAAFAYHISVPVHTVFRSSSLVWSVVLGYFVFNQRFSIYQLAATLVVTVGLICLTLAPKLREEAEAAAARGAGDEPLPASKTKFEEQLVGIAILITCCIMTFAQSALQERLYRTARNDEKVFIDNEEKRIAKAVKKKKSPAAVAPASMKVVPMWLEQSFLTHLMSLPFFLVFQFQRLSEQLSAIHPDSYGTFLLNAATQLLCICSVQMLAASTTSFTLNLTLTMRKFVSLVISTFTFGHYLKMTNLEWAAMIAVAGAGIAYPFLPKARAI